jgi:hypothetical protein
VTPGPTSWQLAGFEDALDRWIDIDQPSIDLRVIVGDWIFTRYDDPFSGVSRELGFDNLWVGVVPGTQRDGTVVVCSYFVYSAARVIAASGLSTLNLPV